MFLNHVRAAWIVSGCLLLAITETSAAQSNDVSLRVQAALTRASEGDEGWEQARAELKAVPGEVAIPAILEALKGSISQRADLRLLAYTTLADHDAAQSPAGREQLVTGLRDASSEVQRVCCAALGKELVSSELDQYRARLVAESTSPREKEGILKTLGGWGSCALPILDSIANVFTDAQAGERPRWFAAQAMLNIGGVKYSLARFKDLDPEAEKVVMWSLGKFLGQKDAECFHKPEGEYREGRSDARKLVLKTLNSPHQESRIAAAEVLFTVYGSDFVVFRSATDYEWDQEIRSTLAVLKNDANHRIREGIDAYFATSLDDAAKNLLRKQARHEKRRSQSQKSQSSSDLR